jgi:hypothetical protein
LTVNGAEVVLAGGTVALGGVVAVQLSGTGPLVQVGALDIGAAASLAIAPGNRVIRAAGLSIAAGGVLDVSDNDLTFAYSDLGAANTARQWIRNGILGQTPAIVTSVAAANAGLGLVDNRMIRTATWDGQAIAAGGDYQQVIIKHTYRGDANLDGQVTEADYANVVTNLGRPGIWFTGDLNHDGMVTSDDFAEVTLNLGAGVAPPPAPQLLILPAPQPVATTTVKRTLPKPVKAKVRKPLPKVRIRV